MELESQAEGYHQHFDDDHSPTHHPISPSEDDMLRFVEKYPEEAATILEGREGLFETWRKEDRRVGDGNRWAPFANKNEWELAQWLMKNVGQNKIEEFFKLGLVCTVTLLMRHTLIPSLDQEL